MGASSLRKTKLHGWHIGAGARMVEFSGWDMPVLYPTGPKEEHLRVRSAAGLFDIDHMGRFAVMGKGALDFLQYIQTWDAARIGPGRAHYAMLCNDAGGVIDDIFIYRMGAGAPAGPGASGGARSDTPDDARVPAALSAAAPAEWLVVVNAGNRDKDLAWMHGHARRFGAEVRDVSDETCMVALQGPEARAILGGLTDADLSSVGHHSITICPVSGVPCIVCTSGYTGEPGVEIMVPAAHAEEVWRKILSAGAPRRLIPCGLAARDSLRAEACLPLYGHEIDENKDPYAAGLAGAAVRLDGHDCIGRQALTALSRNPPARKLAGLEMTETAVPRQGYPIASGGREIGFVTTGLFSPGTGRYLGMGYVEGAFAGIGQEVDVVIRGAPKAARIVERPFYRSPHWGGSRRS